jgi:hypothetical protein
MAPVPLAAKAVEFSWRCVVDGSQRRCTLTLLVFPARSAIRTIFGARSGADSVRGW